MSISAPLSFFIVVSTTTKIPSSLDISGWMSPEGLSRDSISTESVVKAESIVIVTPSADTAEFISGRVEVVFVAILDTVVSDIAVSSVVEQEDSPRPKAINAVAKARERLDMIRLFLSLYLISFRVKIKSSSFHFHGR